MIFTFLFVYLNIMFAVGQQFQLSSPKITSGDVIFNSESFLEAELALDGVALKYTLDGTEPTLDSKSYSGSIKVNKDMTVSVSAFHDQFLTSLPVKVRFIKIDHRKNIQSIKIQGEVDEQYKGNLGKTLYDHVKGSMDFSDGKWLGFKGQNVALDLQFENSISEFTILVSTLTNTGSWILGPGKVSLQILDSSAQNYKIVDEIDLPKLEGDTTINNQFLSLNARLTQPIKKCKIVVNQLADIPEWHPGSRDNTWIFLDEIIVK